MPPCTKGDLFIERLTSSHLSISKRRPLFGSTAISVFFLVPPERRKPPIALYMECVYRAAGGTATDILVHFPAGFSNIAKVIDFSSAALCSITSSCLVYLAETSKRLSTESHATLKNTSRVVGVSTHFCNDKEYPAW